MHKFIWMVSITKMFTFYHVLYDCRHVWCDYWSSLQLCVCVLAARGRQNTCHSNNLHSEVHSNTEATVVQYFFFLIIIILIYQSSPPWFNMFINDHLTQKWHFTTLDGDSQQASKHKEMPWYDFCDKLSSKHYRKKEMHKRYAHHFLFRWN